jgi:thiamine pyrophosphokinase
MKKCVIAGAGEFNGLHSDFSADYIIAADSDYLSPDLLIGDLDSVSSIPEGVETIRFPQEKDASDLELACDEAIRRGFGCLYIYGALGGRLDHTLASIAVLVSVSRRGISAWLIGADEIITAVTNGRITLSGRGTVSIFPAGEKASGVTLSGLKYTMDNGTLTCDSSRGLSNEFVGENVVIEVRDGTLIIVRRIP